MKKTIAIFSEGILSRDQMRSVQGGFGSCTFSCSNSKKSCTSATGNCKSSPAFASKEWISCDNITYNC